MNPAVITAPVAEAREKRDQYAAFIRSRRAPDAEVVAAHEIYQLLAAGKKLLDVGQAIRDGGFDAEMRPRLALARADRLQVCFTWPSNSDTGVFNANAHEWNCQQFPTLLEPVNFNRRHGVRKRWSNGQEYAPDIKAFALVPMVPPIHRPVGPMKAFHILWEVERWAETRIGAKPPVDPYLLRRVRGDLFEVIAEWDLTEVERLVMEGRARARVRG